MKRKEDFPNELDWTTGSYPLTPGHQLPSSAPEGTGERLCLTDQLQLWWGKNQNE